MIEAVNSNTQTNGVSMSPQDPHLLTEIDTIVQEMKSGGYFDGSKVTLQQLTEKNGLGDLLTKLLNDYKQLSPDAKHFFTQKNPTFDINFTDSMNIANVVMYLQPGNFHDPEEALALLNDQGMGGYRTALADYQQC